MSTTTVQIDQRGRTLVVTIARPEARNAVDGPTAQLLYDAFKSFDADDGLDVAILTGSGGHFCAGADLKAISTGTGNVITRRPAEEIVGSLGPMGPTRLQLSKPVIAAVEGFAVAGGLELALWCDLRVAATDATFGVYCRRWGVPLVDGGTVRLPRLIGQSVASDMILTGRAVEAEEALRVGLANRLADPGGSLAASLELANQISAFPQICMRGDRESSMGQWSMSLAEALSNEAEIGFRAIDSEETRKGAERFASGRGRGGDFADI